MVFDCSNGINRGIVTAAFGLALVSAAPKPDAENAGQQPQIKSEASERLPLTAPPILPAVLRVDRSVLERPCREGKDNRESDLCAQWKAADSAGKAAWWAAFGTVVAMLGTAGLYYQIHLTRKAVQDTRKATEAMFEANQIAKAEQRPWVKIGLRKAVLFNDTFSDSTITSHILLENVGRSVATVTGIELRLYTKDDPAQNIAHVGIMPLDVANRSGAGSILPGGGITVKRVESIDAPPNTRTYFPILLIKCSYRGQEDVDFRTSSCFILHDGTGTTRTNDLSNIYFEAELPISPGHQDYAD